MLYGLRSWALPRGHAENGPVGLLFGTASQAADIGFNTAVGVVLVAPAVPVVRGLAAMRAGFARAWLSNRALAPLR
ncbi:hypothetical protein [Streptomyces axinellae]|uniref:Uncharacterized protein n=1 Tax=Streptomyces axinellae TaxID=552788 RepID=A0ABN3Q6U7_9ACTN